jgi:hypothetical protein
MEIYESNRKGKRFVAVFSDDTITHFGLDAGTTYIDVGDKKMRKNYIARHKGLKKIGLTRRRPELYRDF